MAQALETSWDPIGESNPRRLHNMYVSNLVTAYVSKFLQLTNALLHAAENANYLPCALCGRAQIEITATLRYYLKHDYEPLFAKGNLDANDMRRLIETDDRHLRGTRFDWDAFLFKNYAKLKEDVSNYLAEKRKKNKPSPANDSIIAPQVNVLTCVEHWAAEQPGALIAYNLFCDLVHPNIGSNFLVASATDGTLQFQPGRGHSVGHDIFEQSLPILLATAHRPFGPLLMVLEGTMWQEDEL